MEGIVYNPELEEVTIPTSYSLENKLIYVCILEYLKPFATNVWQEDFDLTKFKAGLQNTLITNFKYAFTKIEASLKEDGTLEGHVQYTGGKVLTFNLQHSKILKQENGN